MPEVEAYPHIVVGHLDEHLHFHCPECSEKYAQATTSSHLTPVFRVNIGIYSQQCSCCKKLVVDGMKRSLDGGPLNLFGGGL